MTTSEERKSLFAKRDLVLKLQEIAINKGVSLYSLVNSVFENYIKLYESGIDLEEALELVKLLSRVRSAGFILIPENTWYTVVGLTSSTLDTTSTEWRDLGTLVAKYFSETFSENVLTAFSKLLEYMGVREVIIRESEDSVEVKTAGFRLHYSYSSLLARFIEGFLVGLGYTITIPDVNEGVITVKARKEVRSSDY